MGVNGSSVEGRVRGLSENYLGFRALEFRPLNPVSVGLRIYGRNLNAIFLFVILYRLILNPLLIAPAEFGAHDLLHAQTPFLIIIIMFSSCLLPLRGTNNKPRLFHYYFFFKWIRARASSRFQIIFIPPIQTRRARN